MLLLRWFVIFCTFIFPPVIAIIGSSWSAKCWSTGALLVMMSLKSFAACSPMCSALSCCFPRHELPKMTGLIWLSPSSSPQVPVMTMPDPVLGVSVYCCMMSIVVVSCERIILAASACRSATLCGCRSFDA